MSGPSRARLGFLRDADDGAGAVAELVVVVDGGAQALKPLTLPQLAALAAQAADMVARAIGRANRVRHEAGDGQT